MQILIYCKNSVYNSYGQVGVDLLVNSCQGSGWMEFLNPIDQNSKSKSIPKYIIHNPSGPLLVSIEGNYRI